MFCSDIAKPLFFLFSDSVPPLLYYSHIPTALFALIIGFFVFLKSGKVLVGKLLLALSVVFALWTLLNLLVWVNIDSRIVMFAWSFFGLLCVLIYVLSFYFTYVFIFEKDLPFYLKTILSLVISPVIIFSASSINIPGFNLTNCEAIEGQFFIMYYFYLCFIIFLATMWLFISGLRKFREQKRKQIWFFSMGISFFLLSFFVSGYLSSIFDNFKMEQYGLFGMPIFLGFLAYIIVKYKAFSIKLIGAQALVVTLILLVGSQFFYATDSASIVLTGITLSLALGFGYMLIKSIKHEVKQKEQLQKMTNNLKRANEQLKKLDDAKTEFISVASHQLRTPITAIKGFSSLVLEGTYGEISESVNGAMEKIYTSSQRLIALIEDLLDVSRIESGKMQFNFAPANVETILKELRDNFALIAKSKKFYLNYEPSVIPLPEVVMDGGKIRELVSNFIDNALKYTEQGGVTISAELRSEGVVVDEGGFVEPDEKSQFGPVVRITVADTGIGIPKEEIPYLFKKFSRGKDVSRLHVGGTGLGLFVGKAIAEAHHGQVWIESEGAGMGSKFIIEIPVGHVE